MLTNTSKGLEEVEDLFRPPKTLGHYVARELQQLFQLFDVEFIATEIWEMYEAALTTDSANAWPKEQKQLIARYQHDLILFIREVGAIYNETCVDLDEFKRIAGSFYSVWNDQLITSNIWEIYVNAVGSHTFDHCTPEDMSTMAILQKQISDTIGGLYPQWLNKMQ